MPRTPTGRPRGNPAKPTAVKRKLGNPGQHYLPPPRAAVDESSITIPDPPRALAAPGRAVWDRAWQLGAAWIERVDQDALLIMCEQQDERHQLRSRVLRDGNHRERQGLRALDAQIASTLSAFGFTPADRSRLGIGELGEVDELAKLRSTRTG